MLGTEDRQEGEVVVLGVRAEAVSLSGLLHDGVVLVDDLGGIRGVLVEGDALGLALLQARADGALSGLGHGSEDCLLTLSAGVDDDGAVVGDCLQRHTQIGVLVDGVQAYKGDRLILRLDFTQEVGTQSRFALGGCFLHPRRSPLGPQVVDAAHGVLIERDERDLRAVLAPRVATPHPVPLGLLERLPHACLLDGK